MKLVSATLAVTLLVVACSKPERVITSNTTYEEKPEVKVLRDFDTDNDYKVVCIDMVKYLINRNGGMTVKFQANEHGDPSAEECE